MRKYLRLLKEEMRRNFILMKRYWLNDLSIALTVYFFFLIIITIGSAVSGATPSPESKAATLVGMLMWQLSLGCMNVLGISFLVESQTGTLEHLYLSPMGVIIVFLARSITNFVHMLLVMSVSATLAMLTTGVRLYLPLSEVAVILPLSVMGTYGFGFILASFSLTFKRTQQLMAMVQFFFLLFTGSILPLERMHWLVRYIGQTLPVTHGIQALREVTIYGATLVDVGGLVGLITVTSILWLIVGISLYIVADRRARFKGSIGQY